MRETPGVIRSNVTTHIGLSTFDPSQRIKPCLQYFVKTRTPVVTGKLEGGAEDGSRHYVNGGFELSCHPTAVAQQHHATKTQREEEGLRPPRHIWRRDWDGVPTNHESHQGFAGPGEGCGRRL